MKLYRDWHRRRVLRRARLPDTLWSAAVSMLPLLRGLSTAERARLHDLSTLFLHEKAFEAAGGLVLSDEMLTVIAAQACLPILNLDLDWYEGWSSVIVYPGEFVPHREEVDEAGVVHMRRDPLSGEAWLQGPVILSWEDIALSGACDGYNVVIHELAHKLDMLNGDPNGFPPLHRDMNPQHWTSVFTAAYDDMNAQLDAGADTAIDPYAAEAPDEFFAVLSEYFFEQPQLVRTTYPEVYQQLSAFYRQDPAARHS